MVEILPSILAADFARLGDQVAQLEAAGCKMLHVDVMDGHFVPNISLGPPIVESLRKVTKMKLDVHLMITDPDKYAPFFIEAGADQISVHQEACKHLDRTLNMIRAEGAVPGVVINPGTPVETLDEVLDVASFVLVMSVNPGFGGQKFIPNSLKKIRQLTAKKKERGLHLPLEIDGGLILENVASAIEAGIEWVVAGSSVFHTVNPANAFLDMQKRARDASGVRV